jgi:hypothetical protein
MKLSPIQTEVLNDNLSKAHQLAELMYQDSIEPTKQHIAIHDWQEQLKRLSIRFDNIKYTHLGSYGTAALRILLSKRGENTRLT